MGLISVQQEVTVDTADPSVKLEAISRDLAA